MILGAFWCQDTLGAQTRQPYSIQGSIIRLVPSGPAFEGTDSGTGFELQVRRTISAWSLGGGLQYSRHHVIDLSRPLSLLGLFAEPRYVVDIGRESVAPYVSVRAAVFRQGVKSDGISASAFGGQANAGGGVLIALTRRCNLDVGLSAGYMRFGNMTGTFAAGGAFSAPAGSGRNVVLRIGAAVGMGK